MRDDLFDRKKISFRPLGEREDRVRLGKDFLYSPGNAPELNVEASNIVNEAVGRIRSAVSANRPVIVAFGAHAIKNGLGPLLASLMEAGWISHLATNGAGIIHDWELAYRGSTSEDVRANIKKGQFGIWEETGFYLNLALIAGAREGLGYGESVGRMIFRNGLDIPASEQLMHEAASLAATDPLKAASALDMLNAIKEFDIRPGFMEIVHPYREYSAQYNAFRLNIPFTGHPMIGHDIIYTHPVNSGAATGRTGLTDFLKYAKSISRLTGGVYLSVGSAVMSPMIFEKSLSMARNIALQENSDISGYYILVVDLSESKWNWDTSLEPPADDPAYYLRYCKTFARMGGEMRYLAADNRDFLTSLANKLLQ